jgi:hypothetical protein
MGCDGNRTFLTPIGRWNVLCECSAVVTAPLLLQSGHALSVHLQVMKFCLIVCIATALCVRGFSYGDGRLPLELATAPVELASPVGTGRRICSHRVLASWSTLASCPRQINVVNARIVSWHYASMHTPALSQPPSARP